MYNETKFRSQKNIFEWSFKKKKSICEKKNSRNFLKMTISIIIDYMDIILIRSQ